MSGTDGGFILPENVDPPTFCMTLEVPDDPQYIASLAGALWELQYWWNWQRDNAHTAVPVTRLWRRLIQEAFDRINAGHLCPVPTSINVAEMEYEMSVCEQLRIQDGKLQGLCCGEWTDIAGQGDIMIGGPDQTGSGAPQPAPGGGCQTYHAQFVANSQYLVPTVVSAGDTITFSNAKGAGHDGAVGVWNCPNGQTFFADGCVGVGGPQTGDPATAVDHMALVAKIGATWYPAYSGVITVPGGVSNAQIVIQANDTPLSDNSGSYALDVQVCNNTAISWTHTFNFALTDGGFAHFPRSGSTPPYFGEWVAGSGWVGASSVLVGGLFHHGVEITLSFSHVTINTASAVLNLHKGTMLPGLTNGLYLQRSGSVVAYYEITSPTDTDGDGKVYTVPAGSYDTDNIEVHLHDAYYSSGADGASTILTLTLTGPGTDPF